MFVEFISLLKRFHLSYVLIFHSTDDDDDDEHANKQLTQIMLAIMTTKCHRKTLSTKTAPK